MSKAWLACCFFLPALLSAEEATMAWHFAVPQLDGFRVAAGGESEKVIADPPSPTVFAAKGDRLIDLSAELRKIVNGGNETWLIWNETRHQLVAHGNATTLARVEEISRFQQQPQLIDVTINWYEGIALGDAIPEGKVPDASLSTMARSGKEVVSDWIPEKPASLSRLQFKITANRNEEGTAAELEYFIGWREPSAEGALDWILGGSAPVRTTKGTPLILGQAVSPTGKTWTIAAMAQGQLLDGTPMTHLLETERNGKSQQVLRQQVGKGDAYSRAEVKVKNAPYHLLSMPMASDILHDLGRASSDQSEDPFAAGPTKSELPPFRFAGFSDAMIPEECKAFAGGPLIDCRKLLVPAGVVMKDADFFGYEPRSNRIIAGSDRKEFVESVGMLFNWTCRLSAKFLTARLKKTSDDEHRTYLTDVLIGHRSGQKAVLECASGGRTLATAAVEAILGEREDMVDLRYDLKELSPVSGEETVWSGDATLMMDQEMVLQSGKSKNEAVSFSAKVKINRPVEDR